MIPYLTPDVTFVSELQLRRHTINVECDVDVAKIIDDYENLRALGYTREAAIERLAPTVEDSLYLELADS